MKLMALRRVVRELSVLWEVPELDDMTTIEFSDRMSRSLGRCIPARRLIRLNAGLRTLDDGLIREVLCHELAHLAVYVRYGANKKPHGKEWSRFVKLAGYEPTRRAKRVLPWPNKKEIMPTGGKVGNPRRVQQYEHRCPVCQLVRISRSAVPRWCCSECVADGLRAQLVVSKIPMANNSND